MGKRVRTTSWLGWLALVALAWNAFAQTPPATRPAASPRAVATVGTSRIDADEFERRARAALEQYRQRGAVLPAEAIPVLRRQVLEGAIRGELMALEAKRTGALVPIEEAEAAMKQDPVFHSGGRFDETRWLTIRATQKPQFEAARERMRVQLSGQRLAEQLLARFTPEESRLRAEAEKLAARVDVGHWTLARRDFDGTFPEPREQAVYDRYRQNPSWYWRPDRVVMSVVFVNTPGLTPEERQNAGAVREWNAAMRRSADSLLAAARGGSDLATLAVPYGGIKEKVVATRDGLPAYWKGDAAVNDALFSAAPGALLGQPVSATEGWLVVRVESRTQAHQAEIAEVAAEIRGQLRDDLKRHHVEYEMRDLHARMRDSLAGPAWRVRWAFADPQAQRPAEPSAADLERYYRSRLADYSRFDAAQGRIVAAPLAEVRDEVLDRVRTERRLEAARAQAERIRAAWTAGRREAPADRQAVVAESAPLPRGAALDGTAAGGALAEALWKQGPEVAVGIAPVAGGFGVWQVVGRIERHVPTLEQARESVQRAFDAEWAGREERGARALFERDPSHFRGGGVISFQRANVTPPEVLDVPLTRAEVETWFRANPEKFSAPEQVRVRHLLVSPVAANEAAERAAREEAEALLARARGGEDFVQLVRQHSDDAPTRERGGDLGLFGHGVMLPEFERAAFQLRPGQMSGVVRTEAGYHILECLDYEPEIVQPLDLVYANVASDAARVKAESIAVLRADSLIRLHRTPAAMRRALERSGYEIISYQHRIGDEINSSVARPFFEALEKLKPGQLLTPGFRARGIGIWIAWVDSISPPTDPAWEEARPRAIAAYRAGAGQRALEAKRAEIDSLEAAGWSPDTLAALWGGPKRVPNLVLGAGIPGLGATAAIDSFVFGAGRGAPASVGQRSGWIGIPDGFTRLQVLEREGADPEALRQRMQALRSERIEVAMRAHFAEVAKRHPVRILDPQLRSVALPEPQFASGAPSRR